MPHWLGTHITGTRITGTRTWCAALFAGAKSAAVPSDGGAGEQQVPPKTTTPVRTV